ncbi:unnamed protein product [Prorocentrum cordatum]|uniref:Uncharacterized protein n=1 Tax=Prorocentrum cordatum TaxID=2364126 RepID=A0ABN9VAZ1_9DINO|nr:unnamed protein product [Polarella glacialis]
MTSFLVKGMRDDGIMGLSFSMDVSSFITACPDDDTISDAPMRSSGTLRNRSAEMTFVGATVKSTAEMAASLSKDIRKACGRSAGLRCRLLASICHCQYVSFPKCSEKCFRARVRVEGPSVSCHAL